jgi:hypothetical protein
MSADGYGPFLDRRRFLAGMTTLGAGAALPAEPAGSLYLETSNGWYVQGGRPIWGYAQQNEWWGGYRGQPTGWWTDIELGPSLIRNDPGKLGPNRTEDLERLTDNMRAYGYPGFQS